MDIKSLADVLHESFMALEFEKDSLSDITGIVVYPKEFFE